MTKTKKRALDLMHNGYYPHNSFRRVFPKWPQAYAIAKSEDRKFARGIAARLMGGYARIALSQYHYSRGLVIAPPPILVTV